MSNRAYLGWIDRDGTRHRSAIAFSTEMAERIALELKASLSRANDRAVPEEEIDAWMAGHEGSNT